NEMIQADEINIYFQPLGTGDPVKVIGGIDMYGGATMTQISANNSGGIVHGANGRLPITFVDRISAAHIDLVSIDPISRAIGNGNFSESTFPSINGDGDKFCFLAYSFPPQIWVGHLLTHGAGVEPKINGVYFNPFYVTNDGLSTAEISAYVSDINDPIDMVTFESFKDGSHAFRALTADGAPRLFDDGTHGDQTPGDKTYTNNTVRRDLPQTPVGEYIVRIAAVNTSHRKITMVDAKPFTILDESTSVENENVIPNELELYQNYPNPFNPTTVIKYGIPLEGISEKPAPTLAGVKVKSVTLKIFDLLGKEVATLVNEQQKPGTYKINWDAGNQTSGIYFYEITTGTYRKTKKMILLR
ncbi:MAG: T9SS type A sorting domain-containing protein, partial [Melioribacteraceae bacterium]|nr:T9SS type A sorting domain-containing protein [Melioribacteraceae bacterium]